MRTPFRPTAWIDVETTGLDPRRHEIIDVAVVFDRHQAPGWLDLVEQDDYAYYTTLIRPERIEDAEPKALEINGYAADPARWEGAPTFAEVAHTLGRMLMPVVCVGHNVAFDVDFIQTALLRTSFPVRLGYQKVDTVTLAHEHLVQAGLVRLSLDSIREFLGWSKEGAHAALKDALDARRLHKLLVRDVPTRTQADWVQLAS